jgi:hypothetical protein
LISNKTVQDCERTTKKREVLGLNLILTLHKRYKLITPESLGCMFGMGEKAKLLFFPHHN